MQQVLRLPFADQVIERGRLKGQILNVIVETKDVENQTSLRRIEQAKIDCAKVFFNQLTIDGYKVEFKTQLNNKRIREIIDEVIQ